MTDTEWDDYTQQPSTRPRPVFDSTTPTERTVNIDDVREGLERLMPVLEVVVRFTPIKADNLALAFLKALLASDEKLTAAVSLVK